MVHHVIRNVLYRITDLLLDIEAGIKTGARQVPAEDQKLSSIRQLVELLSDTGGRPDILMILEEMPE